MKRKKPKGFEHLCVGCPNEIRSAKWCEEYGACPEGRREDWGETAGKKPEETAKVKEMELQDAALGRMFWKAAEKEKALTARVAELEEQLASSQRREKAAVADIEALLRNRTCEHRHHYCKRGREVDGCDSDNCEDAEWRGPQEAGEARP